MVVFQGLRPALAGVVCGLAAAFGLTRLIASFLFGVKPWDPLVFFVVPVILIVVALVAVWLPAMRASRVDPIRRLAVRIDSGIGSVLSERRDRIDAGGAVAAGPGSIQSISMQHAFA